jgi:hypothetical protein
VAVAGLAVVRLAVARLAVARLAVTRLAVAVAHIDSGWQRQWLAVAVADW